MSNEMYKSIIESYYRDADSETYWFVDHDENMVVIADRRVTTCTLYETAKACCEKYLFPLIENVLDQNDLKYCFTQKQIDFLNEHCKIANSTH